MTSKKWETMGEIKRRTGVRAEVVVEKVIAQVRAGEAGFRCVDDNGVKITQFISKENYHANQ